MKTLIITLEYPPRVGGIASFVYNLAVHLPSADTIVYAPRLPGDRVFDANQPWKTYRCRPYFFLIWPRWLKMLWQVWRVAKREKAERIFVQHALPGGYVAKIVGKILKIPYTIFFHGTDLELGAKFKRRRLWFVASSAAAICVNSRFLRDKLLARLEGLDEKKIKIIYPCPADFFFDRAPAEELAKLKKRLALEGKQVIITVARLAEGKGYPHLARILPKILKDIPNLIWLIVGDGPKKKFLLEEIQKRGLQSVVRFLGEVEYQELPKYYQVADLFVLLTHPDENREEGWGMVFLEAAASGLPAVAGRVGGTEEAVRHLQTGLVVDVYQEQSVVSSIVELLRDRQSAHRMGEEGRKIAMAEFRWSQQVAKI